MDSTLDTLDTLAAIGAELSEDQLAEVDGGVAPVIYLIVFVGFAIAGYSCDR